MHKTLQTFLFLLLMVSLAKAGDYSTLMDGPVSVAWDEANQRIFVGSTNGFGSLPVVPPYDYDKWKKRIVVVDLPQERFEYVDYHYLPNIELYAPGGMLYNNDTLYIADPYEDQVIAYVVSLDTIIETYPFLVDPDSLKIKDLCMDTEGTIYVTDGARHTLYEKSAGSKNFTEMSLQGESLYKPTCMYYDEENNRILVTSYADSNAAIQAVYLDSNYVTTVMQTTISDLVGITRDSSGYYHVSSRYKRPQNGGGDIYRINGDFTGAPEPWYENEMNLSDIYCLPGRDSIIIPLKKGKIKVFGILNQAPVLNYPLDNAENTEHDVEFSWENNAHAYDYELQVSHSSTFTTREILWEYDTTLAYRMISEYYDNKIIIPDLLPDTVYYWRVRAQSDIKCKSPWSEIRSFRTASGEVSGPLVIYPAHNTSDVPDELTFTWNEIKGAGQYRIMVADNPDFELPEIDELSSSCEFPYNYLDLGKEYFWKVKAIGSNGTDWSECHSFTTAEPVLSAPELIYPYCNACYIPMDIEMLWDTVPGATSYLIQIDPFYYYYDNHDPWRTFIEETTSNEYFSLQGLGALGYFKWRVKAFSASGNSAWSDIYLFETADTLMIPPGCIKPSGDGEGVNTTPTLSWTDRSVDYYDIQLAEYDETANNIEQFLKPEIEINNVTDTNYTLLKALDENTKYVWRVRSNLYYRASSAWSEVSDFVTEPGNSVKEAINPDDYISVIPQPVTDNARIILNNLDEGAVNISLYSMMGEKLRTIYTGFCDGTGLLFTWNTAGMTSGTYYLNISAKNLTLTKKIVVTK